jgi:RNA-directed DNA polymerase
MRRNTKRKIELRKQSLQLALPLEGTGEARTGPGSRVEAQAAVTDLTTLASAVSNDAASENVGEDGRVPMVKPDTALPRDLMERVVEAGNMARALERVRSNKGAPGVDGMTVSHLREHLSEHWTELRSALLDGSYQPQAIRRVEIPKPDGGVRELGIPTVVDRLVQQAVLQVLGPYYDATFSPSSYGFRPGKSAHQALEAARGHVDAGYGWVVDMDLEKFFDRVNHDILMGRLSQRIPDKRLLRLIRGYVTAGILQDGVVVGREQGTPQGGPLSPLLANILLDELDKELERRGHRFCRYADDCNIYVRTRRAGERVMASVTLFLERKLRLQVNPAKSAVDRPIRRKFLGQRVIRGKPSYLGIHPRSVERLKQSLRRLTRRSRGISLKRMLQEVGRLCMGWVAYHRHAKCQEHLKKLDAWLRRRLRCFVWKQWKTWRNRAVQLMRLGIGPWLAYGTALNSNSYWKTSKTPALTRSLTDNWLVQQGFKSLYQRYRALNTSGTAGCGPARPVV